MAKARQAQAERFEPDPIVPLIRTARQQIDRTPGGALGWLLDFVRSDPATWLPGDVDAHGHRLLALIYGPLPPNLLQLGKQRIEPLVPGDVVTMHDELYGFFHQLVTVAPGVPVQIPTEGLEELLVRASAPSKDALIGAAGPSEVPAIFGVSRGGPRRVMLYQEIKRLVLESDRLMACPTCGRPFLALRKKKFCDSECLRTWHDKDKPGAKNGGVR